MLQKYTNEIAEYRLLTPETSIGMTNTIMKGKYHDTNVANVTRI